MSRQTECQTGAVPASPHPETKTVQIVVNGDDRTIPPGLNVEQLLALLGLDPERVAVEMNRLILRRPDWSNTGVVDGARFEIVQFVGGG